MFNKQPYFTDMIVYQSKEDAKSLVSKIKTQDRTVRARIVKKSAGVFIYFDENSFSNIKKGKFQNLIKKRKSSTSIRRLSVSKPKSGKSQKLKPKKKELSILERQERLPQFLMKRLSKKASSILHKSVIEITQSPKKDLEIQLDLIRSEQVKFDIRYEHEKDMLNYINRVARIIEKRIRDYEEREAEIFIKLFIAAPIKTGEFKKQLSKLEKKGYDEVAYLIFRKLSSRTKRKYPHSESRLITQIRNYISSNYKM